MKDIFSVDVRDSIRKVVKRELKDKFGIKAQKEKSNKPQVSCFTCYGIGEQVLLGSIRFSSTKSTDSTFNLHRETNGKRLKRLTWLIETISVDRSMGNRGKCKQSS